MSATLCVNRCIVEAPNVGICLKLRYGEHAALSQAKKQNIPMIELLDDVCTTQMQDPDQMLEQCFPYTKFKLMHDVDNQCEEDIEVEALEGVRKSILKEIRS